MLFADDTLVFCRANPDHLRFLRVLLLSFEVVSSLKINLAKSVLVPVGDVDNMDGCHHGLWCFLSTFKVSWSSLGGPF